MPWIFLVLSKISSATSVVPAMWFFPLEYLLAMFLISFQRLYLKDKEISNLILMGDFLTDTIFQDRSGENIITKEEFLKKYETIVNMSDHDLAESMELEPEYASLIVPNMVIIRNFIEIFQAEALWIPGVSEHLYQRERSADFLLRYPGSPYPSE